MEAIFELRATTRENAISRERLAELGITPASVSGALARGETRGWVGVAGSHIVGFCIAHAERGEVQVLAVRPEFEGRGVGRALLSDAVAWLRIGAPPRIWLGASDDPRTRSHGFYRSLGWRPTGERDAHGDEVLVLPDA
jgi:GNAT superfamily N-acetyltransferase